MRYSTDPYILHWNDTFAGTLPALQPRGAGAVEDANATYDLPQNADHYEISDLRPRDQRHLVRFTFNPAFPDVISLRDGAQLDGTFHIDFEKSMGSISGVYQVRRSGDRVNIELHPAGGWLPGVRKWAVRLMFFMVKLFKNWPKTYRWTATLDVSQPGAPQQSSQWSRSL